MKKIWEAFKTHFAWILGAVLITAILDLIGLGTVDAAGKQWDIGLGFILAVFLAVGAFIYNWNK